MKKKVMFWILSILAILLFGCAKQNNVALPVQRIVESSPTVLSVRTPVCTSISYSILTAPGYPPNAEFTAYFDTAFAEYYGVVNPNITIVVNFVVTKRGSFNHSNVQATLYPANYQFSRLDGSVQYICDNPTSVLPSDPIWSYSFISATPTRATNPY